MIQDCLKIARDQQKSYADAKSCTRRRLGILENLANKRSCEIWEEGKLNPCYVRPFEILKKIRPIAYRLALTLKFVNVHNVFHISMLRKYVADPTHVLEQPPIALKKILKYEERPVRIMDTRVK